MVRQKLCQDSMSGWRSLEENKLGMMDATRNAEWHLLGILKLGDAQSSPCFNTKSWSYMTTGRGTPHDLGKLHFGLNHVEGQQGF